MSGKTHCFSFKVIRKQAKRAHSPARAQRRTGWKRVVAAQLRAQRGSLTCDPCVQSEISTMQLCHWLNSTGPTFRGRRQQQPQEGGSQEEGRVWVAPLKWTELFSLTSTGCCTISRSKIVSFENNSLTPGSHRWNLLETFVFMLGCRGGC